MRLFLALLRGVLCSFVILSSTLSAVADETTDIGRYRRCETLGERSSGEYQRCTANCESLWLRLDDLLAVRLERPGYVSAMRRVYADLALRVGQATKQRIDEIEANSNVPTSVIQARRRAFDSGPSAALDALAKQPALVDAVSSVRLSVRLIESHAQVNRRRWRRSKLNVLMTRVRTLKSKIEHAHLAFSDSIERSLWEQSPYSALFSRQCEERLNDIITE